MYIWFASLILCLINDAQMSLGRSSRVCQLDSWLARCGGQNALRPKYGVRYIYGQTKTVVRLMIKEGHRHISRGVRSHIHLYKAMIERKHPKARNPDGVCSVGLRIKRVA